jgi:hypothetical protein
MMSSIQAFNSRFKEIHFQNSGLSAQNQQIFLFEFLQNLQFGMMSLWSEE